MRAVDDFICQYLNDGVYDPEFPATVPREVYSFVYDQINNVVESGTSRRVESFFSAIWGKTEELYSKQIRDLSVQSENKGQE